MTDTGGYETGGYTAATVVLAEGARVGIVTCRRCGVALLLDPREPMSVTDLHDQSHEEQTR